MTLRKSPWCLAASARVASLPSSAACVKCHAVGHHTAKGVYAGVQVVLDFVEIAVVGVGDLGRDSPFEIRSTYSADTFNGLMTLSSVRLKPSMTLRKSP